jgi:Do/DeqQ family serine protease
MVRRAAFVTLFVLVGFVAGLVLTGRMRSAEDASAQPATPAAEAPAAEAGSPQPSGVRGANAVASGLPDLTAAAQIAIPSVPNISSTQVVRTPSSPFMNDPFFRDFFGADSPFGYRDRLQQSLGSGVVVSSDGYVLTNSHVIGDARSEVSVTLPDKRELRAKIVGIDEPTDLALLKIEARNLPVLAWGDSSKLKIAEWVLAIGNPFGVLNQTVTLGIVSATGRNLQGSLGSYVDFIQTDAAINQGNSGGALINARGELIGINTAIFSQSGGSQGVGFAVPSNLAKHVMDDILAYGGVRRGTITGIELYPMNANLAEEFKAPNPKGVIVSGISQGSEAFAAGIRQYDIIVSFNNTPIEDATHFMRMLSDAPIGGTVSLGIFRAGKTLSAKVPIVQSSAATRSRRR